MSYSQITDSCFDFLISLLILVNTHYKDYDKTRAFCFPSSLHYRNSLGRTISSVKFGVKLIKVNLFFFFLYVCLP